jgi:hypothetical protein
MVEGIPGEVVDYYHLREGYGGGRALPLVSARLRVADYDGTQPIAPETKYVAFTVDLQAGETLAQTYLYDVEGRDIGAYYVYVERLDDEGWSA